MTSISYTSKKEKKIINFVVENIQDIWNILLKNKDDYKGLEFELDYKDGEKLLFEFIGKGSFGIVLKISIFV